MSKFELLLIAEQTNNLSDLVSAFLTSNFVSDDSLILAWALRRMNCEESKKTKQISDLRMQVSSFTQSLASTPAKENVSARAVA